MVEEEDFPKNHQPQFSQNVGFAIYGQGKTLIVSASTVEEKQKWIRVSANGCQVMRRPICFWSLGRFLIRKLVVTSNWNNHEKAKMHVWMETIYRFLHITRCEPHFSTHHCPRRNYLTELFQIWHGAAIWHFILTHQGDFWYSTPIPFFSHFHIFITFT